MAPQNLCQTVENQEIYIYICNIIYNIIYIYIYIIYTILETHFGIWGYQSSDNGNLSCSGSAPKEPPSFAKEAQQEADGASSREPEAGSSSRTEGQGSRCYIWMFFWFPYTDMIHLHWIFTDFLISIWVSWWMRVVWLTHRAASSASASSEFALKKYVIRQFKWVCLHIIFCSVWTVTIYGGFLK